MIAKKNYSVDFKHQVLQSYLNGKTFTETVKQYGISGATLSQWIKKGKEKNLSAEKQLIEKNELSILREVNAIFCDISPKLFYILNKNTPYARNITLTSTYNTGHKIELNINISDCKI